MKKILQKIWDEFIYGGHLLSLGAAGILYFISVILDQSISVDILIVAYSSSQAMYLFNRYKEFEVDRLTNPSRTNHVERYVEVIPFYITFLLMLVFGIMFFERKYNALIFSLLPISLGFLYSVSLKKITSRITGFKTIVVSFIWALYAPFFIIYFDVNIRGYSLVLVTLFIFLRWFINTSFFDIKDLSSDKQQRLKTLPIFFGEDNYRNILQVLNIISFVPIILGVIFNIFPAHSLYILIVGLLAPIYLCLSVNKLFNNITYYFIADSEFLLWGIILFLVKL